MPWLILRCLPWFVDGPQPCGRKYRLLGNAGLQRAVFWERLRAQRGASGRASKGAGRKRKGGRQRERRAA